MQNIVLTQWDSLKEHEAKYQVLLNEVQLQETTQKQILEKLDKVTDYSEKLDKIIGYFEKLLM